MSTDKLDEYPDDWPVSACRKVDTLTDELQQLRAACQRYDTKWAEDLDKARREMERAHEPEVLELRARIAALEAERDALKAEHPDCYECAVEKIKLRTALEARDRLIADLLAHVRANGMAALEAWDAFIARAKQLKEGK